MLATKTFQLLAHFQRVQGKYRMVRLAFSTFEDETVTGIIADNFAANRHIACSINCGFIK